MEKSVCMARKIPPRFESFNLDGVTENDSFDVVRKYAADFDAYVARGVGLLLVGPNGAGKTGALAALHNSLATKRPQWGGKERIWCKAYDIATTYNYGSVDATFDDLVDDICHTAPWMVVDELGRETKVANSDRRMFNLLRTRADNCLVTHFTSNLTLDEIKTVYGEGFHSTLHEVCVIAQVGGDDRRIHG